VSGNAQQRKSRHVLHHGSLLYDFDLAVVARYLRPPEREPAYRGGRAHDQFLTNLPADAGTLKRLLTDTFLAVPGEVDPWAREQVPGLVEGKYRTAEWVRRR